MDAQVLIQAFDYNKEVIENQLKNVTHQDSLIQVPDTGQSINWLLGHIISARSIPLQRVQAKPVWADNARARYRNGSQPDDNGMDIEMLKKLFFLSHERLIEGLGRMNEEELRAYSDYGNNNMFQSFLYFHFHETYHIGQLTMVAMAIGKEGAYLNL